MRERFRKSIIKLANNPKTRNGIIIREMFIPPVLNAVSSFRREIKPNVKKVESNMAIGHISKTIPGSLRRK
jgi:hypothetical protein